MSIIPADIQNALEIRRFTCSESAENLVQARQVRFEVFIKEQNVPVEEDFDEVDDEATHWLIFKNGEPAATGRLYSYQEACQARPVAKIGRIAILESYRGLKLGERLMREIIAFAQVEGYEQCILDGQTRVRPFYEKLGFIAEGNEFDECNIPHYQMRLVF